MYLQVLTDKHAPEHYRWACVSGPHSPVSVVGAGGDGRGQLGNMEPTPAGSLLLPQGAGQRVPVRRVWPGLPLPQGLTHEPCPQVLCVVSLAVGPHTLAARPAQPCQCRERHGPGTGLLWAPPHLLKAPRTWPSRYPSLPEGPGAGMRPGSRRPWGSDAGVPSLGSKEPAPLARVDCTSPTFTLFLLLNLVNKLLYCCLGLVRGLQSRWG